MAFTIAFNDPQVAGEADLVTGTITVDAVAPVTTTVSFTTGNKTSTACSSIAGLGAGTLVEIAGAGAGGTTLRTLLRAVSATPSITLHHDPLTVTSVLLTPCAFVPTGNMPRKVELIDLTNRIEYKWVKGMEVGTMLKRDAAGVMTYVSSLGISPVFGGFYISQSILAASSSWVYSANV